MTSEYLQKMSKMAAKNKKDFIIEEIKHIIEYRTSKGIDFYEMYFESFVGQAIPIDGDFKKDFGNIIKDTDLEGLIYTDIITEDKPGHHKYFKFSWKDLC